MVKMEPLAGALSLLLLLSFTNLCVGDTRRDTVVFLEDGQTSVSYRTPNEGSRDSKSFVFSAPAFVGGLVNNKEFVVILSAAKWSTPSSTDFMGAVCRTSYERDYTDLGYAKALINPSDVNSPYALWGDVTAVMKERNVYALTTTWDTTQKENERQRGNIIRNPFISVGTIQNTRKRSGGIHAYLGEWEVQSIKDKLPTSVHGTKGSNFVGGTGNGIVTTNGTIMFPIVMFRDTDVITSTLYSIDNGKSWNIGGATESDTTSGSLVEWNDGKLLFDASSNSGYRKVFESNDMGVTWKKSPIFFGVWGNDIQRQYLGKQGSVITAPVDKLNVLLFSHTLTENKNSLIFDNVQLWLSDGQRIMCVGTISQQENEKEYSGNSMLAYVNEHLYVTQRMNPLGHAQQDRSGSEKDKKRVIGLTPLPELFEKVKTTVRAWRDLDNSYQKNGINTSGLVGVLGSVTDKKDMWADMYNCVNATVKGGEIVSGGFNFKGAAGSGAKWSVISQGQNQLYKFTENAFTITATVKIETTSEVGDISLIGASDNAEGKSVLIGLGYKTKEKKWFVMQQSGVNIDTEVPVVLNKEYKVAIIFANGQGAVFVNGVNIANKDIRITGPLSIDHFFIGGTGLSSQSTNGNSFTVKNVMLFSRALPKSEIEQFGKIKNNNEQEKQTEKLNGKNVPVNLAGSLNSLLSKNADGTNGAAVSLSSVAYICFVCLLIAMIVF